MYGTILLGVALGILALCAGISALRGFSKSALRCITILISAVAALITCWVIKDQLPNAAEFALWVENNMSTIQQNLGGDVAELLTTVLEFAAISPTLVELVIQMLAALLAPIVCLVLFFLYCLITGIIYFIVKLIIRRPMKALNKDIPLSRLWAAGIGLIEGVIIIAILFLPISGYLAVAGPTVNGLVEQEIMDPEDDVTQTVVSVIDEINQAPTMTVYRTLGGTALSNSLMDMKVAGMDVNIEEELDPVLGLIMNITELGENEMADYGTREAELIRSIAESFNDSKLLAPIVGDILYAATDAWLNGEEFLGVAKPDMGEASYLFGPFVDALLEILHDDAKTAELLQKDIGTVADVIAILVDGGVMANLENTDALLETLSGEGVVKNMITTLGENDSMKRLIPEVTNLGVRAIGQVLSIPENAEVVYDQFMDDVADALNEISSKPKEEQVQALTEELNTAFDNAGVAIDKEIMDLYSASMINDLVEKNDGDVTVEDVKAFFQLYAESMEEEETSASAGSATGYPRVEVLNNKDRFAGTVYAGMSDEELRKTGPAVLAGFCVTLSKMDGNDDAFVEKVQEIVADTFTDLLGENSEVLVVVMQVEITKPVSADTLQNSASLQSVEELKVVTKVVTMEDLLIDTKAAAENMTTESIQKDAEAISAIFGTAGSLMNSLSGGTENLDLTTIADSMGTILDSMKNTDTFGEDKTANLFTAVLQSNTVRDSIGLDMSTATNMANKVTEGGGNYSQTMGTVAGSMSLVDKIKNDEDITDDELVELIQNLTPETAGVLEIFMDADRMVSFGVPEKNSGVAAELVSGVFSYMANEDIEDYDAEAKGLKQVLLIALSAKKSDNKQLFSSAVGANDGKLPHPDEIVDDIMGSKAIVHSINDVMTDGSKVTSSDPFGLAKSLDKNPEDKTLLSNAVAQHRAAHPENSALSYAALEALLGLK